MAITTTAATTGASANVADPSATSLPPSHKPSVAGSVIEASDGLGGKTLIRIQNISSTANLGVRLDLKRIALKCRNTEYNPRRFGAVIMRLREPKATALIFASGKMCVTGVKSTHNATLAAKKFAYIIERVGNTGSSGGGNNVSGAAAANNSSGNKINVEFMDFKVQNIVGTADVGFPIRLEGLVYAHSTFASYEPELFPGLIYRLVSPRVVFLIFVSGKVVITGAKTELDLSQALTKLYPVLYVYRKVHVNTLPTSVPPTTATTNNNNNATQPPALTSAASINNNNHVANAAANATQTTTTTTPLGGIDSVREMEEV